MQTGNVYNFSSAAITRGTDSVKEVYGEVELPLLRGLQGAEELTLNVSGRWTDYKSYGSDTTYKIGLLYAPVNGLSFRAAQGTSYRAPALFEQFLGATSGFQSSQNDPCNNYGAGRPDLDRATNCASEGLAPDFQSTSSVQNTTVGGKGGPEGRDLEERDPRHDPAARDADGLGRLVVRGRLLRHRGGQRRRPHGTRNILSLCYNDPNFISGRSYCRLISRAPAGTNRALTVNDSYINLSTDIVKGYDFTLRYVRNIGPGQFLANGTYTKYTDAGEQAVPGRSAGNHQRHHRRAEGDRHLDLTYKCKEWRFRYGLEWIGPMSSYAFYEEDPATSTYKMDTPSYSLHNVSVQYTGDKWSVIVGVRNVADKVPPSISQGFANRVGNAPLYSGFDYFGRTFFVNVQKSF